MVGKYSETRQSVFLSLLLILLTSYLLRQAGCDITPNLMPTARTVVHDPIPFHREPEQESIELSTPIRKNVRGVEYLLEPLATYKIFARVVSRKRYYLSDDVILSPVDLALAWGSLTTPKALDEVKYDHGQRFLYYWPQSGTFITIDEIYLHTANVHIIPSNNRMETVAKNIRIGDIVVLEGYLVNVSTVGGFTWRTSLVRTDRAGGACEVLYLVRARVNEKQF